MTKKDEKRKLRPLVITLGSNRKAYIEALFNQPCMREHFEPPSFSPGVPSRELRSCYSFLNHASRTGIIPKHEWDAISKAKQDIVNDKERGSNDHSGLMGCLEGVPVLEGRRGCDEDVKLHYCKELWQKAKSVNRGRNVLACLFAHLIAMKTLVEQDYDFILEDNVRAPISISSVMNAFNDNETRTPPCADRIRHTIDASEEWERETTKKCHLRYFGWLGSRPNLEFIIETHCPRSRYKRNNTSSAQADLPSFFPFPVTSDINTDNATDTEVVENKNDTKTREPAENAKTNTPKKPGGTLMWGAYAYWVSKEGHKALIDSLQQDVGSLLWKGKRMRYYTVKPIDKVMPRKIMAALSETGTIDDGRDFVHVATDPAFFRAPMLTSQIHSQWDSEFCKSTEYQMLSCWKDDKDNDDDESHSVWDALWLTDQEREVIIQKTKQEKWLTLDELSKITLNE